MAPFGIRAQPNLARFNRNKCLALAGHVAASVSSHSTPDHPGGRLHASWMLLADISNLSDMVCRNKYAIKTELSVSYPAIARLPEGRLHNVSFFSRHSRALAKNPLNPGRRFACPRLLSCAPPALLSHGTSGFCQGHGIRQFAGNLTPGVCNGGTARNQASCGHQPRQGLRTVAGGKPRSGAAPGQPSKHQEPWRGEGKSC